MPAQIITIKSRIDAIANAIQSAALFRLLLPIGTSGSGGMKPAGRDCPTRATPANPVGPPRNLLRGPVTPGRVGGVSYRQGLATPNVGPRRRTCAWHDQRDRFPSAYVGDLVPNGNQASRYLYRSARTALWVRPKRRAASITVSLRSSAISISLSVQGAL